MSFFQNFLIFNMFLKPLSCASEAVAGGGGAAHLSFLPRYLSSWHNLHSVPLLQRLELDGTDPALLGTGEYLRLVEFWDRSWQRKI
mgnify:CR=1 FL=1